MEIIFSCVFFPFLLTIVGGKWMPELTFSPNFDLFHLFKSKSLENRINSSFVQDRSYDFQWQTMASVSLESIKTSYLIYGGSQQTKTGTTSAFSKSFSAVVVCELVYDDINGEVKNVQCKRPLTNERNWNLGAAVQAVRVSDKGAAIVYCDPLWHVDNASEPKPSGKCYLDFMNNGQRERNSSIEFCRLSSKSFSSCLGGFSVDIISTTLDLSGLQMVVGMPYLPNYGSVKLFNDPFGRKELKDFRNGVGKYFNFGYAVAMTKLSMAYASSPLSDHYGPNVTSLRQDLFLTSPDNEPFSSFGLSLKTLSIDHGNKHAVVVGAPFHSLKSLQNVGKIYVFCISNGNDPYRLASQIFGGKQDEFYGFVISDIGDINGDGNNDLAIGSPFLRSDIEIGFVSIYTVGRNCEVSSKPLQILRSSTPTSAGIFGISVTGGFDVDFNNWPDIAVLSSNSNTINVFTSRQRFTAKCAIQMNKNFENDILRKDVSVLVKVNVQLLDHKSNIINLDFLENFNLISQIDPNYDTKEKRFEMDSPKVKFLKMSEFIMSEFKLKSLMSARRMNLSAPVVFAYRFVEDCQDKECKKVKFPLIDWENCKKHIPVSKYICDIQKVCDADLSVELTDTKGTDILYGYDIMFYRTLELKLVNYGPTEGKDINFNVYTYQNLRIHKINSSVTLRQATIENQTEARCTIDMEEMDLNSTIIVYIDLYFVDFNEKSKMKYMDNYVTVQLVSDVKDSNSSNNQGRVDYSFIYEPNITFSGSPSRDTVIDMRNRTSKIRVGQRMPIDSLGPRLSHRFIIENVGNSTVRNMLVRVSIPVETSDKYIILYLFDKIRGVNKSEAVWMSISPQISVGNNKYPCTLPKEFINRLNLIGFETHQLHLSDIEIRRIDQWAQVRKRRSVNDKQSDSETDYSKISQKKMYRIPIEIIQCDRIGVNLKAPTCAELHCRVPVLLPKKQATLQVNAWLFAYTFFKKQLSDIMIYTTLRTEFEDIPDGVKLKWDKSRSNSQSQQFIFQNVKPKITHLKPWWPIIIGIVIGILILAILIVAMYKCGFFQRNKIRRRFKSGKAKKGVHHHVIVHPGEQQTISSINSETKFTSHSALIK